MRWLKKIFLSTQMLLSFFLENICYSDASREYLQHMSLLNFLISFYILFVCWRNAVFILISSFLELCNIEVLQYSMRIDDEFGY